MTREERTIWATLGAQDQPRAGLLVAADWYAERGESGDHETEFALRWAAKTGYRPELNRRLGLWEWRVWGPGVRPEDQPADRVPWPAGYAVGLRQDDDPGCWHRELSGAYRNMGDQLAKARAFLCLGRTLPPP